VGVNKKPAVPELQHRNKVYKERHNRSGKWGGTGKPNLGPGADGNTAVDVWVSGAESRTESETEGVW
jgi:hypothetical protein